MRSLGRWLLLYSLHCPSAKWDTRYASTRKTSENPDESIVTCRSKSITLDHRYQGYSRTLSRPHVRPISVQ
ncbi:hypothetical protein BDZ45DRAFT_490845 [Acephala macrosclerotiorum]|nr:hypothetical protein BDZ45DRAFT_490845 [Acephala macrosclerotiorum]